MKKISLSLWGLGCFALLLAMAAPWGRAEDVPFDYYRCTRDTALLQAMAILAQSSAHESVDRMLENDTKVLFKDMREMGKIHKNDDALSIVTEDGHHMIFINIKHESAPPQALAALIGHEVLHSDADNSVQEELIAWTREGTLWKEMLDRYPELKQLPNYKIPLVDRENALQILLTRNQLRQEIEGNVAYQGLPAHSPGF